MADPAGSKPPPGTPLFRLDEVADGGSAGFVGAVDGVRRPLLAVRRGESVFVYVNSCPHVGAPLDWRPGRFLTADGSLIQCTMHGALFRIEDGHCLFGPCAGKELEAVAVEVRDGAVHGIEES